jgi:hypothetical protein
VEEDAEEDKKRFFHRRAAKVPSFKSWDEGGWIYRKGAKVGEESGEEGTGF